MVLVLGDEEVLGGLERGPDACAGAHAVAPLAPRRRGGAAEECAGPGEGLGRDEWRSSAGGGGRVLGGGDDVGDDCVACGEGEDCGVDGVCAAALLLGGEEVAGGAAGEAVEDFLGVVDGEGRVVVVVEGADDEELVGAFLDDGAVAADLAED